MPLVVAILVATAVLGGLLHQQTQALQGRSAARPTPTGAAPAPPPSTPPAAAAQAAAIAALAELGDGRVVYRTDAGHLVVLWRDPTSAELEVERVYVMRHDPARHLGEPDHRYHGYYLDDLEAVRRAELDAASARYRDLLAPALPDVEAAEAAARELVALGAVDRLRAAFEPGSSALHYRSAALALGEAGYLCAVEPLTTLVAQHAKTPAFVRRLGKVLERLTGMSLLQAPLKPERVVERLQAWQREHPLDDPFARAP